VEARNEERAFTVRRASRTDLRKEQRRDSTRLDGLPISISRRDRGRVYSLGEMKGREITVLCRIAKFHYRRKRTIVRCE
jgi:hypothetical protein